MEPKLDKKTLTSEQQAMLESYEADQKSLLLLGDIADMTQEMLNLMDGQDSQGLKTKQEVGALLMDMRDSLAALNNKEIPETPDHTKPMVEAVAKLEKTLSAAIKDIDVNPNIRLDAPSITTEVDMGGVEKAIKEIPKAFEEAIKLIPKTEIPEADYTLLIEKWDSIAEQLVSIETATRMKPLPGSMKISNLNEVADGIYSDNPKYSRFKFDPDDVTPTYIGKHQDVAASTADADWVIYKFTYSGGNTTDIYKIIGVYDNRAGLF